MSDNNSDRSGKHNQREHFRVAFPPGAEISVSINDKIHKITEISERGMRVQGDTIVTRGGICRGFIRWSDDSVSGFSANVHRREQRETILFNVAGVTLPQIINEQRRLIMTETTAPTTFRIVAYEFDTGK